MKEYKVIEADKKTAENTMNEMARQGWEVVDVCFWSNLTVKLIITFSREI